MKRRDDPAAYSRIWRAQNQRTYNANMREYHARRMAEDPVYAQRKRDASRWARRKAKYGITRDLYEAMMAAQDGKCAICEMKPDHDLRVDHDHETGAVRALLCMTCNSGLGHFRDDPVLCKVAAAYLEYHKPHKEGTT